MANIFILFLIAIISSGLLATFFTLVAKKKIKTGGPISVYIALIFMPIFIVAIPLAIVPIPIYSRYIDRIILIVLFAVTGIIISCFILIKANIFPHSVFEKKGIENKKILQIDYGKRLLKYSIFTNLLYITPFNIAFLYILITYNQTIFDYIKNLYFTNPLITAIVLLTPFGLVVNFPVILAVITISCIAIITCFAFVFSINGTIRIISTSKKIREMAPLYIFLMLIPIANIVCMFWICHLAKKEIKDEINSTSVIIEEK